MISLYNKSQCSNQIILNYASKSITSDSSDDTLQNPFDGKWLSSFNRFNSDDLEVIVGLGNYDDFSCKKIKSVLAKGVKQMKQLKINAYSVDISLFLERFGLQCLWDVVEGIMLGLYQFKGYKKEQEEYHYNVYIQGVQSDDVEKAQKIIEKAENLINGVVLARDMVNTPGNKLTPGIMAQKISQIGTEVGFEVEVIEESGIKDLGMDAYLTVGTSSANPPNLIVMRYFGADKDDEVTALVGKGVTCDTGGYCLKSSGSMTGIKGDMAGGAAVFGAIYALAKNNVKANVVGVIPACENRISEKSFLPGDVINSMSGKTIEILNTDAEGRLILADAVTYAIQVEKATKVLDVATLTGSVVNALGFTTAGLLTNNEDFYNSFMAASEVAGEQYWRLPIYDEYRELLKTDMADIKNMGKSYCGTITAGLFIEAFVEQLPWIHLDIAGTAWVDTPVFEYQSVGATGSAVTSIYFLLGKDCG